MEWPKLTKSILTLKIKPMSDILKSASKIVLILMTLAAVVGLFTRVISEETFKTAMLMVFTFYFASKGDSNQPFGGK